jgi:hypothetical protein
VGRAVAWRSTISHAKRSVNPLTTTMTKTNTFNINEPPLGMALLLTD